MSKKIEVYLESSALWNLYYEQDQSHLVEYCLTKSNISCASSIWSLLELRRGVQKRLNQQEVNSTEAGDLWMFIQTDLQQLVNKKHLSLHSVTENQINYATELIPQFNLYASDALHLSTALLAQHQLILVDDYHFERLKTELFPELRILPTSLGINEFNLMIDEL
jgi:hypothetical protein